LEMYEITLGEHADFHIPFFAYRGTPVGIDVFKVLTTGITPCVDAGLAGKDGGQIGAGILRLPIECFQRAAMAYEQRYGRVQAGAAAAPAERVDASVKAADAPAGPDAAQP